MNVLLGVLFVGIASVGLSGGRKHRGHHAIMHGLFKGFEDCAHSAEVSNETVAKMKESMKDPHHVRERLFSGKLSEDMKAVVKQAESDKVSSNCRNPNTNTSMQFGTSEVFFLFGTSTVWYIDCSPSNIPLRREFTTLSVRLDEAESLQRLKQWN